MNRCKLGLVLPFVRAGCVTTANYERILSSWVGTTTDNLVMLWGPPSNSYPLSNGGRVLEYSNQRNIQLGGYTTTVPQTTYSSGNVNVYGSGGCAYGNYSGISTTYVQKTVPVQNIAMQCITRFTVDAQGIIRNWAWQGNDCKAMDSSPAETTRAEPSRNNPSTTGSTGTCDKWGNPKDVYGNPCR